MEGSDARSMEGYQRCLEIVGFIRDSYRNGATFEAAILMPRTLSKAQRLTLKLLIEGGQAIERSFYFESMGRNIGTLEVMERLEKRGFVLIERVGKSRFAKPISDATRQPNEAAQGDG